VFFGSTGAADANDRKEDVKAFFRVVDAAVMKVAHDPRVPLILATFDHYFGMFREVSRNATLLDERIEGDPEVMGTDALRERALQILRPRREKLFAALADEYGTAVARHLGSNHLPAISQAAIAGRIRSLLIEDGRRLSGKLDRATGEVTGFSLNPGSGENDLLDDVSELVLARGGPATMMPTDVGAAAIYRF
jgi:hypothetical protein